MKRDRRPNGPRNMYRRRKIRKHRKRLRKLAFNFPRNLQPYSARSRRVPFAPGWKFAPPHMPITAWTTVFGHDNSIYFREIRHHYWSAERFETLFGTRLPSAQKQSGGLWALGLSAAIGYASGYPLELVKVRLQTQTGFRYSGFRDCIQNIFITEGGWRAFFKGMSLPLSFSPFLAALIGAMHLESSTPYLDEWIPYYTDVYQIVKESRWMPYFPDPLPFFQLGVILAILQTPVERIKSILQAQEVQKAILPKTFSGPLEVIQDVAATQSSFYRGLVPTLLRDSVGLMSFFVVYHAVEKKLRETEKWSSMAGSLVAAAVAGSLQTLLVFPLDLVKTRIQSLPFRKYRGTREALRVMVASGGYSALFRGLSAALLRVPLVCTMVIVSQELLGKMAEWYTDTHHALFSPERRKLHL